MTEKANGPRDFSWDPQREARWYALLGLIEQYAFGPGEEGLDHLEGGGSEPASVTARRVRNFAMRHKFDLGRAVQSVRDSGPVPPGGIDDH